MTTITAVSLVLLCAVASTPAVGRAAGKSHAELAAEVVRTTEEYRAVLTRALAGHEAQVREATEALQERQALHKLGILPASYVDEAQQAWSSARQDLVETRRAIEEADRILLESWVQEALSRFAPLPRGAYDDSPGFVRFNGPARWSLAAVPKLEQLFTAAFGRGMPVSALGQTSVHDRLRLDHRGAIDVAVHPDSAEGRWLMEYLRRTGISFIGVRSAVPGSSTGAHVHVGPPSLRLGAR
jgi:hypothetical protein